MAKPTPAVSSIGIIVGLDLVGDALIKLPVLRTLRHAFPAAKIHWITAQGKTAYSGPLRGITKNLIDAIHECPPWLNSRDNKEYQKNGAAPPLFDVLIDTRNRWKEALRARKSVPHKVFIAPAWRYLLSDRRPPLFAPRPSHMADRMLQQVALIAGETKIPSERLQVAPEYMAKARLLLPEGEFYVGFAPGAGGKQKIWPLEHFIEVAQAQADKKRIPVFILGPDERGWHKDLLAAVPSALFPLQRREIWGTEKIKIEETLAVGTLLDVAVANDSGTSHMLAAVDCPLVSLFGPTSPTKFAPRISYGRVVRPRSENAESMEGILKEDVLNEIEIIIKMQK
jgi:ADP-heptose:LPS heptosyltransferase